MTSTPPPDGSAPDPSASNDPAWIITGPTSGMGHVAALELANHGTVVLVGRDSTRLDAVRAQIERFAGGHAITVVCDFSDLRDVRRAAAQIGELGRRPRGLANNAGIMTTSDDRRSPQGWDLTYATDHLGPFAFTDALIPFLPDGANVVFTCSAAEDPERRQAAATGFRGGRYLSADDSAHGRWLPGGSRRPGFDAYATAKQSNLATVFALSREIPRLRFRAVEPGVNPGTNLGRDAGPAVQFISKRLLSPIAPLIPSWSNPATSGRLIARILTDPAAATGVYYNERGHPMHPSSRVADPQFCDRVVAETRSLLATIPATPA